MSRASSRASFGYDAHGSGLPISGNATPRLSSRRSRQTSGTDTPTNSITMNEINRELERLQSENTELEEKLNKASQRESNLTSKLDQSLGIDGIKEESNKYRETMSNLEVNDLRNKLSCERQQFQKKISAYQDGQQRQAQLVQKLQQKVLQYKRRCSELEQNIDDVSLTNDSDRKNVQEKIARLQTQLEQAEQKVRVAESRHDNEIDDLADRLEAEQKRCASYAEVNAMLRKEKEELQTELLSTKGTLRVVKENELKLEEKVQSHDIRLKAERENMNSKYSSERNKLIALWKSVLLIKKDFQEVSNATQRDVANLRVTVGKEKRVLHNACSSLKNAQRRESAVAQQSDRVSRLVSERDNLANQLRKKENELLDQQSEHENEKAFLIGRNERLQADLENARSGKDTSPATLEDSGIFTDAIEEIARRVTMEKDLHIGIEELPPQKTRRSRSPSPMRSRGNSPSRPVSSCLANKTLEAVEKAFKIRREQLVELQDKLQSSKSVNTDLQIQNQELEMNLHDTASRLEKIKQERDDYQAKASEAKRNVNQIKSDLDLLDTEKKALLRSKDNLEAQLSRQDKIIEGLKSTDADNRNILLNLEAQRNEARDVQSKLKAEVDRLNAASRQLEQKHSIGKTQMTQLTENYTETEMILSKLQNEKNNIEAELAKRDCDNAELQIQVEKLKETEHHLAEQVNLLENELSKLESDKRRLENNVAILEKDLNDTTADRSEISLQKNTLKDELLNIESEASALRQQKDGLTASIEQTEVTKQAIEEELAASKQEVMELANALSAATRKMESLTESLANCKEEMDRQSEVILRVCRDKENLTKEKARLVVQKTNNEKEIRSLNQTVSALRSDKDQLESALHDAQNRADELEKKRNHLETINSSLNIKNEALQNEISRQRKELDAEILNLENKLDDADQLLLQKESESERAIKNLTRTHDDEMDQLVKDREAFKVDYEERILELESNHQTELKRKINGKQNEIDALQKEIDDLIDDHNGALIEHEKRKQEELSLKEKSINKLNEEIAKKVLMIQDKSNALEQLRRDHVALSDEKAKDLASYNQSLADKEHNLNLLKSKTEADSKGLNQTIDELKSTREKLTRELDDSHLKYRQLDEAKEHQRQELQDAIRKLRDLNQQLDTAHKEALDLKRDLNEETNEKDSLLRNLNDLRVSHAKLEELKHQTTRERDELIRKCNNLSEHREALLRDQEQLRKGIRDVEKSRTELRKDLADVRNELHNAENELERKGVNISDLEHRLLTTEEREDDLRRENNSLLHRITDHEVTIDAKTKESQILQKRIIDLEDEGLNTQRELARITAEHSDKESKLKDDIHSLCTRVEVSKEEINALSVELQAAEGRSSALQEQLSLSEDCRNEAEIHLNGFSSALRRTLGIGKKSINDESEDLPVVPSVETVKTGLQQFSLEHQRLKTQRDDAKLAISQLEKRLSDIEGQKFSIEERMDRVSRALAETEQNKKGSEGKLANAQTALLLQEETIRKAERERKILNEKLNELERNLKSSERHGLSLVHEIDGLRSIEASNVEEKRHLKEEIDRALGQLTSKNVELKASEGENHRLNLALTEKKGECDLLMARIAEIDSKRLDQQQVNIEKQQKIDKLKSELERAEVKCSAANERLQSLNIQLTEREGQLGSDTQRIVFLESKLTGLEHEKQLLNDRLEHTRLSNENLKKQNVALNERLGAKSKDLDSNHLKKQSMEGIIKHQTTELENKRLNEEQLKNKISKLTDERKTLAERVTGLQRAVTQLAAEKQNEHELFKKHARDAKQLRKNVDEAEKERLTNDKQLVKLVEDKAVLEQRLLTANTEIKDLKDLCAKLEIQIQDTATIYERRLEDQTERYRRDMEIELDRVRGVMIQQDRTIDARERAHHARISILEDTCQDLREKANRSSRANRKKQRQTAELLSDLRSSRNVSPARKSQVRH